MTCSRCDVAIELQVSDDPQCLTCNFETAFEAIERHLAAVAATYKVFAAVPAEQEPLWAWAYFMYGRPFVLFGNHAFLNRHGRN